jgi:hypothetical protein
MRPRWPWVAITLAVILQGAGIARTKLPSHDGLKILRTAASFQSRPWGEVIRGTDRHPLYPLLVSLCEPPASGILGHGPGCWRITAQAISAFANIALLFPLFLLSRQMFGAACAHWTCLLWVVLPLPSELGRETVGDPLALFFLTSGLWCAERAIRTSDLRAGLATGVCAGLGFWTRPEAGLFAIVAVGCALWSVDRKGPSAISERTANLRKACTMVLPALLLVGVYAGVKGQVSEKLALRIGIGLAPSAAPRVPNSHVDKMLDPAVDGFEAKAEDELEIEGGVAAATIAVSGHWLRAMGVLLAPLALAGCWLARPSAGRSLLRSIAIVTTVLLIRHVATFHYLSIRHVLPLVIVSLPWAGWRLTVLAVRIADWCHLEGTKRHVAAVAGGGLLVVAGLVAQCKPAHGSRDGHWRAGCWLAQRSTASDTVFDTNGWACFVSDRTWHDPWHLRQALADARLRYFVVEQAEIDDQTQRGAMLRNLLASRGRLVACFGDRSAGEKGPVLVYEYRPTTPEADAG